MYLSIQGEGMLQTQSVVNRGARLCVAYSEVEEQMFGQMVKRAPRIANDDLLDRLNNYEKA
jgi:hypothetical protein